MSVAEVSYLPSRQRSIQGERQQPEQAETASETDVDRYCNEKDPGKVACRMERRHPFPLPRNGVEFSDVDEDGNFIAIYDCPRCGCAYRREVWYATRRGREVRFELLDAQVFYRKDSKGEDYLMPKGVGRAKPSMFRNSVMTSAMQGRSPASLRKSILRTKA